MTCNGTTTDAADAHMSGESHEPAPVPAPAPVFLSGYQASQRGGKMQIAVVDTAGVDEEPCHRVLIKGMCVSVMKSKILV